MTRIHLLDSFTANSIAAGEVVERPSSVVKELVENSLDAGASVITVEIEQGGIKLIRVSDDGSGLDNDDARLAFQRHATSKMSRIDDLEKLITMGFRGEALASIAAVSKVFINTRQHGTEQGIELRLESGEIVHEAASGCPAGTSIQVENLFYNTPARYKFLKRDQTEASYVTDLIERMALARPDISFRLFNQGREILHTPGNNDSLSSIFSVYGKDTAAACLPVDFSESPINIYGYVTSPQVSRHNRNRQNIFVNGRLIHSRMISAAIDEASHTWFMKGRYPTLIINIKLPVSLVDVNVHPQKMEVRFWDERKVFHCIYHGIRQSLINYSGIAPDDDYDTIAKIDIDDAITDPVQIKISETKITDLKADPETGEIIENVSDIENYKSSENLSADLHLAENNKTVISDSEADADERINKITDVNEHINKLAGVSERINKLADARIIGQAFLTYLILECDNELYLVDQHAAHERIIYEKLVNRKRERDADSSRQPLLVPETIQVTKSEKQQIMASREEAAALGFEFDDFGSDTLLLRTVPADTDDIIKPAAAFKIVIDSFMDKNIKGQDSANQIYENIACKAAVKAHDLLHDSEMAKLLKDLQKLENPYHCPHGRPIIIRMSRYELEKKFKRIV